MAGGGLLAGVVFVGSKIADSLVVTPEDLIARDPYLPELRADPMYSWQVDGADRQTPQESPEDLHGWGEQTNSEIIIEHVVHSGIDINALYEKATAAYKAAGYDESGYRTISNGLRINCMIGLDLKDGMILIRLRAEWG